MTDKVQDYPPRFQYEPSSGSLTRSMIFNCGPAGDAQIIDYYRGRTGTPIERLRDIAGIGHSRPTTFLEQATMLTVMGVPAQVVKFESMEQLDHLLGYGYRPIGIFLDMSKLAGGLAGHDFKGWHRWNLLTRRARGKPGDGSRKRYPGYLYTDPNFHPGRPDPEKGKRWIQAYQLRDAWLKGSGGLGVMPLKRKDEL